MNGVGRRLNIIHQSLVRPVLLAGAERPLAIANWITAAALILGTGTWYTAILGALLATAGHWACWFSWRGSIQSWSQVYIRHIGAIDKTAIRHVPQSGRRRCRVSGQRYRRRAKCVDEHNAGVRRRGRCSRSFVI